MSLTSARARAIGKQGALSKHARHDPRPTLAKARAVFEDRFIREVDPNLTLDPDERARRVSYARRAYFVGLALKSAESRRARAKRGAR